jgi:hypothetical protein
MPRIGVLRDLGHARGAAGVEIGRDPVARAVGEGQLVARVFGHLLVPVHHAGAVAGGVLGTDEGDDEFLQPRQVAQKVHLQHDLHVGRVADRLRHLLGDIGFREFLQRDHDLGVGLAQDGGDLLGLQQRVDRVDDPRDRAAQDRHRRLGAVGQHEGDGVGFLDAQRAEHVRGLRDTGVQARP